MSTALAIARTDAATPHPSVAALRTVGLLGATETLAEQPRDLSRAHGVWAVRLPDARRVVVKSGAFTDSTLSVPRRQAAEGDSTMSHASLGAELFVHRMAEWCDSLRAALPHATAIDEASGVLVVEEIGDGSAVGASLAMREGLVDTSADERLFARLGSLLGAIHRETAGLPLPRAHAPLILAALTPGAAHLSGTTGKLVAAFASTPTMASAAQRLRTPAGHCLVHHDLKWDNIAVAADGSPRLVDWELAGSGDPAWDLGCLVAEHLLRREIPGPGLSRNAAVLLRGYAEGARVSARALDVFAARVAVAAVLRVAQFALEIAERGEEGDDVIAGAYGAQSLELDSGLPALTEEIRLCLTR